MHCYFKQVGSLEMILYVAFCLLWTYNMWAYDANSIVHPYWVWAETWQLETRESETFGDLETRAGDVKWVGGFISTAITSSPWISSAFCDLVAMSLLVIYCVEAPRQNQQFSIFWGKKKEQHTSYNTFLKIKGLDNRKQQRWMIAGKASLTKDSYRPGKASKRSRRTILQFSCF